MEGKRFGIGLAAGILLALAVVTVSGGLGSSPLATLEPARYAASTTTVASATITVSATTATQTATSTVSITSTTSASPGQSLVSNVTYPSTVTSSSATVSSTTSSVASNTFGSNSASQSAGTSANGGTPYYNLGPSGATKPTQLASIAQQPIVSNAEILAPVLVAFFLGAFLYRVVVQERERSSGD